MATDEVEVRPSTIERFLAHHDVVVPMLLATIVFALTISMYPAPSMLRDAHAYTMSAQRLVREGIYALAPGTLPGTPVPADARVTPGYILFLAGLYAMFGRSGDPVSAAQYVQPIVTGIQFALAVITVGLIALAGRELGGRRMGLVAGLLSAVYLPFAWATSVSLAEPLAVPLLALQLVSALKLTAMRSRRRPLALFGFGVLSAAVAMVRPSMILWAVVPLAYIAVRRFVPVRRLALLLAVAALGWMLVFAPWWARNQVVIGHFVPIRTDYIPGAEPEVPSPVPTTSQPPRTLSQKASDAFVAASRPWSAPDDVLWENNFRYDQPRVDFGPFPVSLHYRLVPLVQAMFYYQLALGVAALIALTFALRSPRLLLVASVPVYALGVHFSTQVNDRYMFLAAPAMLTLAAAGVSAVWHLAEGLLRARSARQAHQPSVDASEPAA